MKETYVTFKTAKLLKEKGFDWECLARYDKPILSNNVSIFIEANAIDWNMYYYGSDYKFSAPTQQMAMRWLRKEHGLFIEIMCGEDDGNVWYDYDILPVGKDSPIIPESDGIITYEEPEDAIEVALQYCLTNLI